MITLLGETTKRKRIIIQSLLILSTTLALYTNYQALILLVAFLILAFILDLKVKHKKHDNLKIVLPVIVGVVLLFLPYITTFYNHIQTFIQRKEIYAGYSSGSPILSGGYFIFSILFGNSIYPWDIRFIILSSIIVIALVASLISFRKYISEGLLSNLKLYFLQGKELTVFLCIVFIAALFILFLLQVTITGSLLSRGFMIFPLLIVPLLVICFYNLYKIKVRMLFWLIIVAGASFFLIWLIGSYNVITRQSLHKAGLIDPVEEVISLIQKITKSENANYIVITYDPVLTYYLSTPDLPERIVLFSPYLKETEMLLNSVTKLNNNLNVNFDSSSTLIYIQSYLGSLMPLKEKLDYIKGNIFREGLQFKKPIKLGYDQDSDLKRKFFPSSEIIDWRYTINVLYPKSIWNRKILEELSTLKVY
jgi:hypothetical protein